VIGRLPRVVITDVLAIALLFGGASWWGAHYYRSFVDAGHRPSFYQSYFEPAVMMACGHGFTVAADRPAVVTDFLEQRTDGLDCASLPASLQESTDGVFQYAWFYLMISVGLVWKLLGVSWSGLGPVFGVLFGTVVVLAYAIFRIAVPPLVAVVPAIALTVSPLHLQNLPHLRDYAKAPFVLALVLLLLLFVSRPFGARAVVGLAALYGAVLGIGYGFRADLLANIPPLVVTLLLFLPGGLRANLPLKGAALATAAATFMITAWPVVSYVTARGGCQWHVLLLGLDDVYTKDLGVRNGSYQWHATFTDEYLHTAVRSYHDRVRPPGELPYCSAEYDAATGAYYRAIAAAAPADLLTRAYASVLRVTDLPFYWWGAAPEGVNPAAMSARGRALRQVAGSAALAVFLAILVIGAFDIRLGLFAALFVGYFAGYPALQFANRHFFHLEFVGWWAMAFLGWQALRFARAARSGETTPPAWRALARRGLVFAAVTIALVLAPVPLLRAYQDARMQSTLRGLLEAPRLAVNFAPAADGATLVIPADSLGATDPVRTAYLDVHLDVATCPGGVPLGVLYEGAVPSYDFTGPIAVRPDATPPTRVLVPVFRSFAGLTVGENGARCIGRIERLASLHDRALLPTVVLSEGRPPRLHQSLIPPIWSAPFRLLSPWS